MTKHLKKGQGRNRTFMKRIKLRELYDSTANTLTQTKIAFVRKKKGKFPSSEFKMVFISSLFPVKF